MAEDYLAQTIRIDLHPEQESQEDPTVTFRSPVDGVGETSFDAQFHSQVAGRSDSAYQRLLECIYDAVLITDAKGMVLECNQRAIDFLKFKRDDILGVPVSCFICGIDESVLASIRKNLLEHRYTLIEGSCQRSDETLFPSEIAVNRLDLSVTGRLCFFIRNISIRKQAQDALEKAVEKVEKHDRQRSQFISNVSHELRTPLTSMMYAITNMLKGVVGDLSADVDEYLEMLLGDCKRMLGTVNDILDLRKIESKTFKMLKTSIPYARLVRSSVKSFKVQAGQKNIEIAINTDGPLWFVDCDAQRIERVIINLVGNAIKFTPENGKITVTVKELEEHPGYVYVIVDDTGIGIPPEAIKHVTERYFTVGDQPMGSGLGLAISKEIVSQHDGEFYVESPVPETTTGSRFSFRLPIVDAPSVMIVEDDPEYLAKMESQIKEHGYRVVVAKGGEEALNIISSAKPDIIILDLNLHDIDGKDVVMKLKGSSEWVRIPVLAMSGINLDHSMADLLRNFGIPVISKPWNEAALLDGIANAFLRRISFAS